MAGNAITNWMMVPQNGQWLMTVSGVYILDPFKGADGNWSQRMVQIPVDTVQAAIGFTGVQPSAGKQLAFLVNQWAPYATLNSISNDGPSENAGWALDSYEPAWNPPHNSTFNGDEQVFGGATFPGWLDVHLAVRDVDGFVLRVGYYMTLLGTIVEWQAL